jgi:hypothetical protein
MFFCSITVSVFVGCGSGGVFAVLDRRDRVDVQGFPRLAGSIAGGCALLATRGAGVLADANGEGIVCSEIRHAA